MVISLRELQKMEQEQEQPNKRKPGRFPWQAEDEDQPSGVMKFIRFLESL